MLNIVTDTATKAQYITALEAAKELGVVLSVLVLCKSIV
jgi:predicted DNA repair protein MutK